MIIDHLMPVYMICLALLLLPTHLEVNPTGVTKEKRRREKEDEWMIAA